jgi:hypothetical protein
MSATDQLEVMPILSAGKHRNPKRGACFMEFASYLAGERWSDHPACTHPLLAGLARFVNDHTSDAARPRLAPLIPSVIGIVSEDAHIDALLALRAGRTALPIAPSWRQGCLAVGIMAAERVLNQLDGRDESVISEESRRALCDVPDASKWARNFSRQARVDVRGFRRRGAPSVVRCAADGIAEACVADRDERLHRLLAAGIDDCRMWLQLDGSSPLAQPVGDWAAACRLTGVAEIS